MSKAKFFVSFSLFILIVSVSFSYYRKFCSERLTKEVLEWAEKTKLNTEKSITKKPVPFQIEYDQKEWDFLVKKLEMARYFEKLDSNLVQNFEFGFDPDYTRELADHWRTKFNWTERITYLNKFPQFKIEINDTVIHYVHLVTNQNKNLKKVPVMLLDGWPGSYFGFYRMIEYMSEKFDQISFDILVPTIPGFLHSTPLRKPLDVIDTAVLFDTLMRYIHGENAKYYVHGEDWGAFVTTTLGTLYPDRVKGIHLTMVGGSQMNSNILTYSLFGDYFPSYFYTKEEIESGVKERYGLSFVIKQLLKLGYFHIQATFPDTHAHGLTDSPIGLLADLMEKYARVTFNFETQIIGTKDGLLHKFNKDDLLTIVMLYWTTNSISSSIRIYKTNSEFMFSTAHFKNKIFNAIVMSNVSVAYQFFENDLNFNPKRVVLQKYPGLIQYNIVKNGGHFASFQNPVKSADDFVNFINLTL
jgi:pimeloyl-ACP methyl ester carboxylesterase